MLDPFKIPTTFDLTDPSRIAGPFVDLLTDFHLVSDVTAQNWQEYLRLYAQDVELESDSWAAEIMELSMTDELKRLVFDDLDELDQVHVGAITIYKYMTNHMVLRNQETIDALHEWIRLFDIRLIDGENVAVAISRCKAVIRALDGHGLPANALTNLLNGFSHASCEPFAQLCQTLLSMNSTALVQSVQSKLSMKKKIFNTLQDLENKYVEIHTKNKWAGVSHDGAAFAARNHVPFDVWVKDKKCDACGEIGHIQKDCPNTSRRSTSNGRDDRRRRPSSSTPRDRSKEDRNGRRNDRSRRGTSRGRDDRRNGRTQRRFQRAFKIALESLAQDDTSDSDETVSPRAHTTDLDSSTHSRDSSGSSTSLAVHAARVFTSLKE